MDLMTRRLVPSDAVHTVAVDDSLILVDRKGGQYFGLNEVGNAIWQLVAGGTAGAEIVAILSKEYDAAEEVISEDTRRILTELLEAGLIA